MGIFFLRPFFLEAKNVAAPLPLPKLWIHLGIGNRKENANLIEGLFVYEAPPPFFFLLNYTFCKLCIIPL